MTMQEVLHKLAGGESLLRCEAEHCMDEIMRGEASDAQIAAFIMGLSVKGETIDEISGCAAAMRRRAERVPLNTAPVVDTCGTGGDGQHTFNISTTAAFIAAGAGVPVAKHGNRSVSSSCGSADVLECLGLNLDLDAKEVGRCIDELGIGFMYAPRMHPAMRYAVRPRRELGIRTVFNLLGPLTNPAGAPAQLLGVFSPHLTELMAEVLRRLGARRAMVVSGMEGLDEISICGSTRISELQEGRVKTYHVAPGDLGLEPVGIEAIRGGGAEYNARILRRVLEGRPGPHRDSAVVNAGAALVAAGRAADLREGATLAERSIDSGSAGEKLEMLIDFCARLASAG